MTIEQLQDLLAQQIELAEFQRARIQLLQADLDRAFACMVAAQAEVRRFSTAIEVERKFNP